MRYLQCSGLQPLLQCNFLFYVINAWKWESWPGALWSPSGWGATSSSYQRGFTLQADLILNQWHTAHKISSNGAKHIHYGSMKTVETAET